MAGIDDLAEKVLALQAQVQNSTLPAYLRAKATLDKLEKDLDTLSKLPSVPAAQAGYFAGLPAQISQTQDALKKMAPGANAAQRKQVTLDEYVEQVIRATGPMPSPVASKFTSLQNAALGGDAAARREWMSYAGSLRNIPYTDAQKELRDVYRRATASGQTTDAAWLQAQQDRIAAGRTVDPASNPGLQEQLADLGRNRFQRTFNRQNFASHWRAGSSLAFGYGALDLARGADELIAQDYNGRRFTAEARQRAGYGVVQGAGVLAGGLLGSFTPLGPGGGMAVGGAVTSVASNFLSATSERQEGMRLAGESIARDMGRSVTAGHRFADELQKAADRLGTPSVELAQSVQRIARVAGISPAGVDYQVRLQNSLNDLYPEAAQAQARFAASPFGYGYRGLLASGRMGGTDEAGAAIALAFAGQGDDAFSHLQVAAGSSMSPRAAALQARINRLRQFGSDTGWGGGNVLGIGHFFTGGANDRAVASLEDQLDALNKAGRGSVMNPTPLSAYLHEVLRRTAETQVGSQTYGAFASASSSYAAQALTAGQGVAGMLPHLASERLALTQMMPLLQRQQGDLQSALNTPYGRSAAGRPLLLSQLADTRRQVAEVTGELLNTLVAPFRQALSQRVATMEGTATRLGLTGQRLDLSGYNSFSAAVGGNFAGREGQFLSQAAYYRRMALDRNNYLSPEERQSFLSQSASARTQAMGLRNEFAVRRIGDTEALGGFAQSGVRVGLASAQAGGGVLATLTAQNSLLDTQGRLHDALLARLREGNLTYAQRLQLQTRINDLESQQVQDRRAAYDTAIGGLSARAVAQAGAATSAEGRIAELTGTTGQTRGLGRAAYAARLHQVAVLRFAAMTDPNPDSRLQAEDAYQRAAADAQAGRISDASTVSMPPEYRAAMSVLQARLYRQQRSPFEPGSVLGTTGQVMRLQTRQAAAIQAQARAVAADPQMSLPMKQAALASLTAQREELRNSMFDEGQTLNFGWLDRLTETSINSSSFASRLMPSFADASRVAERRGLGPMSARVFGFSDPNSYRAALDQGFLPTDLNAMAYGRRPGDFPGGGPGDVFGVGPLHGGTGTTLDSVMGGALGTGMGSGEVARLTQTLDTLNAVLAHIASGLKIEVRQPHPTTGHQTSQVVNSVQNYDSRAIQRGGAAGR